MLVSPFSNRINQAGDTWLILVESAHDLSFIHTNTATRQGAAALEFPIMAIPGYQGLVPIIVLVASEIGGGEH